MEAKRGRDQAGRLQVPGTYDIFPDDDHARNLAYFQRTPFEDPVPSVSEANLDPILFVESWPWVLEPEALCEHTQWRQRSQPSPASRKRAGVTTLGKLPGRVVCGRGVRSEGGV